MLNTALRLAASEAPWLHLTASGVEFPGVSSLA
jgi:hypothetical protein